MIIISEIVHAFGIRSHPRNIRLYDSIRYLFHNQEHPRVTEFFFFVVISALLFLLVRKVRNLPWFMMVSLLALTLGFIFNPSDMMNLAVPFRGYPELKSALTARLNHLFNITAFFKKTLSGEFFMHLIFFTGAVFLESVTSMRIARSLTDRESDKNLELLALSVTNLVLGLFGLLPVSIPVARNILAYKAGGNNKIYFLFSAFLLFTLSFLIWPVMNHFPQIVVASFNTCLGMMMIDVKSLISLVSHSPSLIMPITVLILGSMVIDIVAAFGVALIIFYVAYFNIGGFEYFRVENIEIFFDDIIRAHKKLRMQDSSILFDNEERVQLNAIPKGVSQVEIDEHGEEQIELIKDNFKDDGVVYTLTGTFNFFNYQIHFNNLRYFNNQIHLNNFRYFNKSNVLLNFKEILGHDLDFLPEYKNLIELLDESGYEVYIAGFKKQDILHNVLYRKVRWLLHKNAVGRVLFMD